MKKYLIIILSVMIVICGSLGLVGLHYTNSSKDGTVKTKDNTASVNNLYHIEYYDKVYENGEDVLYFNDILVTEDWEVKKYTFVYDNKEDFYIKQSNPEYVSVIKLSDEYRQIIKEYFDQIDYQLQLGESIEFTDKNILLIDYNEEKAADVLKENINVNAIVLALTNGNTKYLDYLLRDNSLDKIVDEYGFNKYEKIDLDSDIVNELYSKIRYINVDIFYSDYDKNDLISNSIISLALRDKSDDIEVMDYVYLNDENYNGIYEYTGEIEKYVEDCMCVDFYDSLRVVNIDSLNKVVKENYKSDLEYDLTNFDYLYSTDCRDWSYDKDYKSIITRGSSGCGLSDFLSNSIEYAYKNDDKVVLIGKTVLVPATDSRSSFDLVIYNNVVEQLPLFKYYDDSIFYNKTEDSEMLKSGIYDKFVTYYSFEFTNEIGQNYYLSEIKKLN